jgi:hypothetical protein
MIPVYLAKDETANPLVMDVLICQVVQWNVITVSQAFAKKYGWIRRGKVSCLFILKWEYLSRTFLLTHDTASGRNERRGLLLIAWSIHRDAWIQHGILNSVETLWIERGLIEWQMIAWDLKIGKILPNPFIIKRKKSDLSKNVGGETVRWSWERWGDCAWIDEHGLPLIIVYRRWIVRFSGETVSFLEAYYAFLDAEAVLYYQSRIDQNVNGFLAVEDLFITSTLVEKCFFCCFVHYFAGQQFSTRFYPQTCCLTVISHLERCRVKLIITKKWILGYPTESLLVSIHCSSLRINSRKPPLKIGFSRDPRITRVADQRADPVSNHSPLNRPFTWSNRQKS